GLAGQKTRLQRLVGIEGVVHYLDAGLAGEVFEHPRRHVARPVVEIDGTFFSPRKVRQRQQRKGDGCADQGHDALLEQHLHPRYRRCTASDKRSSAVSSVASRLAKQKRTTVVTGSCS